MAQYKSIPIEFVEYTEIARKCYRNYERDIDAPNEAQIETEWTAKRKLLSDALDVLTPRQREVFILKAGYQMTEVQIADRLGISQAAVCKLYQRAQRRLDKFIEKTTDT